MSRTPQRPSGSHPRPTTFDNLPQAPQTNWRKGAASRAAATPVAAPRKASSSRSGSGKTNYAAWGGGIGGVVVTLIAIALVVLRVTRVVDRVATDLKDRRTIADIEQVVDDYNEQQLRTLLSDAPGSALGADFGRYVSTLEQKAAGLSGTDGKVARAAVATLKSMQQDVAGYSTALQRLEGAGNVDPTTMRSRTDIDKTITIVRDLRKASERLGVAMRGLSDRFDSELDAHDLPSRVRQKAQAGFADSMNASLQAHDLDLKICDVSIDMLNLLKREWGKWKIDKASQAIEFTSVTAEREFNRMVDTLTAAIDEQTQMHRRALTSRPRP